MKPNVLIIHPKDNVAVAISEIKNGQKVARANGTEIVASADIPPSHKIAISGIRANEKIIKYGETIGLAKVDIKTGDWVHTHNIKGEDQ